MRTVYENKPVKIFFNIGRDTDSVETIELYYRAFDGTEGVLTDIQPVSNLTGDVYALVPEDILTPTGVWSMWYELTLTGDITVEIGNPFSVMVKMVGVSITNLEFVKDYLGIEDGESDEKISYLIDLYEQVYLKIRNAPWEMRMSSNDEEYLIYPVGADVTIAEMIGYKLSKGDEYNTITSETIGTYSWSSDGQSVSGFPLDIVGQIRRFVRGV